MRVCVVAIATVRISRIAVALDLARRRALEAAWARSEAGSLASSHIIGEPRHMAWITHEDGSLDLIHGRRLEGDSSIRDTIVGITSATECIVENLATL